MFYLERWYRLVLAHASRISWPILLFVVLLHGSISWILLWLAGEQEILELHIYVRFYMVCISTVGWGAYSPQTVLGDWITALWLIPLGLGIFGSLLAKLVQTFTAFTNQGIRGMKQFNELQDHILIFGWSGQRTRRIVDLIFADKKRKNRRVLLVATNVEHHPMLDRPGVDFARVDSFTDDDALARVAASQASKIIINGADDNEDFTCALKLSQVINPNCHVSVYFEDASKEHMLEQLCPQIECSSSKTAERLVRSMQDPGASRVTDQMLSTLEGMTQYALEVPKLSQSLTFGQLFLHLRQRHKVILLGVARDRTGQTLQLNPDDAFQVNTGDHLHYIAGQRLDSKLIDWSNLSQLSTQHTEPTAL